MAKPRHQPSERDQQAREKLRQKTKIKSCAYIQLGGKVLQTVHQTFEPDIPVILHLPALANTTIDTDTVPPLYVIQETKVYPSMLANKQVPVLNLTKSSITSQADLQDAFQSLCLCSHGRKESTEDKSAE